MSRALLKRIPTGVAICAVLTTAVAVPFGAWAQQNERGGMLFQLRLAERFQMRDATSTDPAENGKSNQLTTDVDFSFSSETRTEAVTLDFGAGYRFVDGPTTDGYEGEFASPTLRLSYAQVAATASFEVSATATQVDLAEVSPLDASTSEDSTLASDFADLVDGGTRSQIGANARLSIRDDAPFGLIFGLNVNDISYSDLPTGSTLNDTSSLRMTTTGRFDVSEVLQIRAGLQYDVTETDGSARIDRYGVNGQAVLARPDGNYRVSGNISDGDGGTQTGLSFGRQYELPQTKADFALGFTNSTSDTLFVTGAASFEHDFGPESGFGKVTATADRRVTFAGGTDEDVVTSLSLATTYAVSPLASLRVSAEYGQSEDVASGETVDLAQAGLTLGYTFDRHWRGSAGLRAERRDPSDAAASESTTLSLAVTRSFDLRR